MYRIISYNVVYIMPYRRRAPPRQRCGTRAGCTPGSRGRARPTASPGRCRSRGCPATRHGGASHSATQQHADAAAAAAAAHTQHQHQHTRSTRTAVSFEGLRNRVQLSGLIATWSAAWRASHLECHVECHVDSNGEEVQSDAPRMGCRRGRSLRRPG